MNAFAGPQDGYVKHRKPVACTLSSQPASADSRCIIPFFNFLFVLNIRHVEPKSCFWIKTLGQVVNTNALCTIDPALPQSLLGPNIESVFPPNLATFGLAVLWIIHSFHHFMQAPQNLHYAKWAGINCVTSHSIAILDRGREGRQVVFGINVLSEDSTHPVCRWQQSKHSPSFDTTPEKKGENTAHL